MARFLTFETTALKLNNSVFPCNSVSFSLNANTVPVFDIEGSLLYYSPTAPIQGKFQTQFYLTGELPSFLKLENQSEVPTSIRFNQFYIPSAYLTSLNFNVEPFQPVLVSIDFSFYHGLVVLNTDLNDEYTNFNNSLKTLNGLGSYLVADNRANFTQNPKDFLITNFSYAFSVEREPVLRIKQSVPSRVAIKQINAEFNITANNLDGILQTQGNAGVFSGVLRDNENLSTSTNIIVSGIIVDQNYSMSESNYGVSNIKMIQNINSKRNILTIPYEVEDYDISIPELTIDDPVPVPLRNFDPSLICGGTAPPPLPPDATVFYVKTPLYVLYPQSFSENNNFQCDRQKSEFNKIQLSIAKDVDFQRANLNGLEDGNNPIPTSPQTTSTPPYYYVGTFQIDKEKLKQGLAGNPDWINFEGNLTLTQRYAGGSSVLADNLSLILDMQTWAGEPNACYQYTTLVPNDFWYSTWSYLASKIITDNASILNQKADTYLEPIILKWRNLP
jgi:hypothetical protein